MISMDYALITRKGVTISAGDEGWNEELWSDPTALKLLIVKDTKSNFVFAHDVLRLLNSDNEPAIVRVLKEFLATLKVSAYDTQANGAVEAAVKQIEARIRTMKVCLERKIGKRIPSRHPIMTWLAPPCGCRYEVWSTRP